MPATKLRMPTNSEKDLLSTEDLLTAVKKVNEGS
jgi:hypothetical protein